MTNGGSTARSRRLDWLEVGRGLAALGVVLAHFDSARSTTGPGAIPFFDVRPLGGLAVEFFFVLSGFIIFFVHGRELSEPAAAPRYAWRRFVRLFPTYWVVLLIALFLNQTVQNPAFRVHLTLANILTQVFIFPGGEPMIGPAWTLRHELLFYAVFGLAIVNARAGAAVFLAWMAAAAINLAANGLPPGMVYDMRGIVLHHYNLDFILGVAIAVSARRGRTAVTLAVFAAAAVLTVIAGSAGFAPGIIHPILLKFVFATVVAGAVLISERGVPAPSIGIRLGAISYSLYISHILIGVAIRGGMKRFVDWNAYPPMLQLGVATAAALTFAWGLHRFFEAPVLRRLQGVVGSRSPPPVAAD